MNFIIAPYSTVESVSDDIPVRIVLFCSTQGNDKNGIGIGELAVLSILAEVPRRSPNRRARFRNRPFLQLAVSTAAHLTG
jgi:hypothetical protein